MQVHQTKTKQKHFSTQLNRFLVIYSNTAIDLYTIKVYSLEYKNCYNIVVGKENTFTFYNKSAATFYYMYSSKVVVSHIQRIGCQPEKTTFFTVANPAARDLLNRGKKEKAALID